METLAKKRKRENSNKKWSPEEVSHLLDFLEEASGFEVPTAQIFYKKILEVSGVEAAWSLVKWKVRNLRTSFSKAQDWRKSTGAGLLESYEGISSVEKKLQKMCPYYPRLKEIFGGKNVDESAQFVIDTDSTSQTSQVIIISSEDFDLNGCVDFEQTISCPLPTNVEENTAALREPPTPATVAVNTPKRKKVEEFAEKMKLAAPKSAVSQLATLQSERNRLLKTKIDLEKVNVEKELELAERKMKLKEESRSKMEERAKQEFELEKEKLAIKKEEMERDERLRKLEIEKDERIAKYELQLKYGVKD